MHIRVFADVAHLGVRSVAPNDVDTVFSLYPSRRADFPIGPVFVDKF
jgi:hypothetical protein